MTDTSPMPWGQYKGKRMIDIPASYLLWLLDNDKCGRELRQYIIDNKDVLKKELKKQNGNH